MFKSLIAILNKVPIMYRNIWWNQSVYCTESKYPIIFDEHKKYINCEVGNYVVMGETKSGKDVVYKIIRKWNTTGSDFLYSSDAVNCDLIFDHISAKEARNN